MSKKKHGHILTKAASHPGISGKKNEDRYQITNISGGSKSRTPSVLAVLCDGIGGHRAGEIAAQMGVSIISETIAESDAGKPLESLEKAIHRASSAIYQASQTARGRMGMGTTCAVAWVIGNNLYTANLGDSRIYMLRDSHFIQLTTDHTWVQEAYDAGLINDVERETHPNAHVIRRYLGVRDLPQPDFRMWYFEGENDTDAIKNQGMTLTEGDTLLLCSDGLTDLVSDNEIREVIQNQPIDLAVDKLIEMANARGGHDNITVILMKTQGKGGIRKPRKGRILKGCLITAIIFSLILAGIFIVWRYRRNWLDLIWLQSPTQTATITGEVDLLNPTGTGTLPPTPRLTIDVETPTIYMTPKPSITPWPTNTP